MRMRLLISSGVMAATLSNGDMKLQESTVGRETSNLDSLSKAAEAASNINALLVAQGKLKPSQLSRAGIPFDKKKLPHVKKKFDAEVEINDAPIICRDILTRNSSQEEISKKSGASISTKGRYVSPENRTLTDTNRDRPLYLYIQAETEDNVQRAVQEINQIILKNGGIVNQTRGSTISLAAPVVEFNQNVVSGPIPELVNSSIALVHTPQPDLSQPPPSHLSGQSAAAQIPLIEEKMFIGLEHAPPSFDVRSMILGTEGSFLQHIHSTSGAVVTLRGRNSGYLDPKTAQESSEPMHIHLKHMTQSGLEHAMQLAGDLIKTVQNDYAQFQRQLALQASPAALRASVSMSYHADHSASLVSGQQAVMNYQAPDQRVMFTSSGSTLRLAAPPLSLMQQPASQMLPLSRAPTYVQAAPIHPLTTSTLTQAVGYNSLTSQGIEVVHQTVPLSRPLASIQPLSHDIAAPVVQPILTSSSHPIAVEAPALAVMTSVPPPVVTSLPIGTSQPLPIVTSIPLPVVTGQPPPIMTTMPPPVVLANQPPPRAISEPHVVLVSQAGRVIEDGGHVPIISIPGPQPLPMMHKPPEETVTYIFQQPVERQLVCIDPPDVSVPPPLTVEHVGEPVVPDPAPASHPPPVTLNEYGEPVEVVEILQPNPHHVTALRGPVPLSHSGVHLAGVGTSSFSNAVPRYASLPHSAVTESAAVAPNLMDLDVHNSPRPLPPPHRPVSSLPPIEPPPHLADAYQSKRVYPEYGQASEHRPPYIGSRHHYSSRSSPPPATHETDEGGPPRHKRMHSHPTIGHPPPPPPV